ncbi:MAG: mechanosensitive ion channel family protein [Crocosphaera sp.]|nr:mechanosensitive ion channel family protein [Crocosphaera sp.]
MKNLKLAKIDAQAIKKLRLPISRLIIIFILSLTLTLTWTTESFGQLSLFSPSNNSPDSKTPPWDLNKAYTCGRYWCSDVYIHDDSRNIQTELLTPELTLAILKDINQSNSEVSQLIEKRSKVIEQVFNRIVKNIIRNQPNSEKIEVTDWKFWIPSAVKNLWKSTTVKPLHPWTPTIKIGIKNNHTVVYIPDEFDLGIASQSIITVTAIDARANGTTVENLARIWQNNIRLSFSNAFWGYEFDYRHPQRRLILSLIILGMTLLLIILLELIRNFLRKCDNKLRKKLKDLTESITLNPEAATSSNLNDKQDNPNAKDNNNLSLNSDIKKVKAPLFLTKSFKTIKKIIKKNKWFYARLFRSKQKIILQQQNIIKQQRNFFQLLLRLSFIFQVFSLLASLIIITLIFRNSRFLSVYFLRESLNLMFLWIGLIILDKITDFIIDYYLHRWANQAQVINPTSNRYTLRINTYSIVLKQATSFTLFILGIYGSVWLIGLNLSVLAGAGVLTLALAFLSRNLLEDMLNGVLILCSDRYAIGDVIDVGGGMAGLVENINLFVTSLRNLDGQVIAIPNSRINTVINNTKEWSRVNFTIKIAWNEDIKKAISVMTQVANQMQKEPEWGSKILDPMEVLGVDDVSHEGILIHVLIRTQPSEHWGIGREFRFRVKQAFDEMGISLGIPHHKISVLNSPNNDDQSL